MPQPKRSVSVSTVAERAGVSIATVSRVVNGIANRASAETTARVWQAVHELGYHPDSVGRALRQRQSRLVALLAANLANPAMAAIAASVEAALRSEGLVMVLCDTHDRAELQDEYLVEMRAQLARATVLLGAVASPQLAAMQPAGETLLFVNRRSPCDPAQPFIGIDNRRAGADVADFLHTQGVTAPGVIHAALSSSATADRIVGFLDALARYGRPAMPTQVATADELDHMAIGYRRALDVLPEGGRRGIFCASDLIAYGAHRRLGEAGLCVPDDVVLVGFDDNPLNDWVAPWLNSVRVPYDRFGPAVVAALGAIRRGESVSRLLEHRLVIRASA
ncbi:MAG: LacI family DNA-binding transcriptional regulator [Nevskiales bacterium]